MQTATDTLHTFHLPHPQDQPEAAKTTVAQIGEPPLAAAAKKPRQVTGPTLDELDEAADAMAALVAKYVGRVAGHAARQLGGVVTAAADPLHTFHLPGQHNQATHGRGDENIADQGGEHGYGRDSHGVSYTEDDVDQDTGKPKFSPAYREKYGPVVSNDGMGPDDKYAVTITDKGGFHIADDTRGTHNREVLEEFKGRPATFEALASDIHDAATSPGRFTAPRKATTSAGMKVEPARAGSVKVTWSSGKTTTFDHGTALDLGDAGTWAPDTYRRSRRSLSTSGDGIVVSAAALWPGLTAQTPPPPTPRQAAVSADDIGVITDQWAVVVGQVLAPAVAADYVAGWQRQQARIAAIIQEANLTEEQLAQFQLPLIDVQEAAQMAAADAANRLLGIGDELWGHARTSLTEGMAKGESVPKLAERVRAATGVALPRATVIARSESMNARNAGAYDEMTTLARLGIVDSKTWISAHDSRVRPTHGPPPLGADGQTVPWDAKFTVGGWPADRPHDPFLPAEESVSCRCSLIWNLSGEELVYPLASSLLTFHLPGKHDQASHGHGLGGVRTSLADAKTTGEIGAAASVEAKRITGRDIPFAFAGADPQLSREFAEGVLQGLERFPNASLAGVHTYGPGAAQTGMGPEIARLHPGASAVTQAHGVMEGGKLVVRSNIYLNTRQASQADRDSAHAEGYLISRNITGTALHEFGHVMTNQTGTKRAAYDTAVEAADQAGVKNVRAFVTHHVSSYAATDMTEFAAESFADVMTNGSNASGVSRAAFDVIASAYREQS